MIFFLNDIAKTVGEQLLVQTEKENDFLFLLIRYLELASSTENFSIFS